MWGAGGRAGAPPPPGALWRHGGHGGGVGDPTAPAGAVRYEEDYALESRNVGPAACATSASFLWLALNREAARSVCTRASAAVSGPAPSAAAGSPASWPPALIEPALVSSALQFAVTLKNKALHNGKAGPMAVLLPAAVSSSRLWETTTFLATAPPKGGLRSGVEVPRKIEPALQCMASTPFRLCATGIDALLRDFPAVGLACAVGFKDPAHRALSPPYGTGIAIYRGEGARPAPQAGDPP